MSEGIALAPEVDESWLDFTPPADLPDFPEFNSSSPLEARQASCERTTSYVLDKTERFVNWDVQMSPVVLGTAEGITVAVSSGYSVANSISASAGIDVTLIKDYLSGSVGVDYTTTWTTTTSNTYTTVIKNGDAGVWVSLPPVSHTMFLALQTNTDDANIMDSQDHPPLDQPPIWTHHAGVPRIADPDRHLDGGLLRERIL
jgi:hypothetical protein